MVDVNLFFQLLHLKPLGACAPPLIVGLYANFIMISGYLGAWVFFSYIVGHG